MDSAPTQIANGLIVGKGVAEWVATVIGGHHDLSQCEGIGYARGGNIVMGAMFNNYNGAQIHMHIALTRGVPFSPTFVAAIMDYPFVQLGLKRVTGMIFESNTASRRFAEHLGAKQEVILQDYLPHGNLVVYGLFRKDAQKWLTASYSQRLRAGGPNGRNLQRQPIATAGA